MQTLFKKKNPKTSSQFCRLKNVGVCLWSFYQEGVLSHVDLEFWVHLHEMATSYQYVCSKPISLSKTVSTAAPVSKQFRHNCHLQSRLINGNAK